MTTFDDVGVQSALGEVLERPLRIGQVLEDVCEDSPHDPPLFFGVLYSLKSAEEAGGRVHHREVDAEPFKQRLGPLALAIPEESVVDEDAS